MNLAGNQQRNPFQHEGAQLLTGRSALHWGRIAGCIWALFFLSWLGAGSALGQEDAEAQAFKEAALAFQDGFYERADKQFGRFIEQYSDSPRVAEVILLQAQARFQLERYEAALELLDRHGDQANQFKEQYLYWMGRLHFEREEYDVAAGKFGRLLEEFAESPLRLDAAYRQALARFKLDELDRTIKLLRQPDGAFQQAAEKQPNHELVGHGYLLLAEAYLFQEEYQAAEHTLDHLTEKDLTPVLRWQKQRLLTRIQLADGRRETALKTATNLYAVASQTGSAELMAESVAMHGKILKQLDRLPDAVEVYSKNLSEGVPLQRRREALLEVVEIYRLLGKPTEAVSRLEEFLIQYKKDPALDLVRLTLGELRLNQFYQEKAALPSDASKEAGMAVTNILEQARVQFDELINNYPQSQLVGKAYLNRGWCLWEEGNFASSQEAFNQAVQQVSDTGLQAVARFKLADAQYQTGDYDAATKNYWKILEQAGPESALPEPMREQALYQIVRSGLEQGELTEATQAMQQILERYPESYYCQRSLILVGQSLNQSGNPALARRVYNSFLDKAPDSSLSPEVQLAVARTYVEEKQWEQAIPRYDQWLKEHAREEAQPRVEFDRAWLNYRAGNEKEALQQFSKFMERYPEHPKAPMAQNWIADYHFRLGDYVKAEINYKLLFQNKNWPASKLTYQGYLMAGRSALARRDFDAAQEYFTQLISRLNKDPELAPGLLPEALFAYGDSWIEKPTPKDDLQKFGEAIKAFGRIANNYPEHAYAPLAWGKIGNCHLQLAAQDAERYAMATNAYHRAMQLPQADPATRNLAEVGLANALVLQSQNQSGEEREALLDKALEHFLNVVYQADPPDLYPVKEAGLAAAKLLENQGKWEKAINLYQQLWDLLPPLRETLQKRIDQVKNQRNDPAKLTQNLLRSRPTR